VGGFQIPNGLVVRSCTSHPGVFWFNSQMRGTRENSGGSVLHQPPGENRRTLYMRGRKQYPRGEFLLDFANGTGVSACFLPKVAGVPPVCVCFITAGANTASNNFGID
jgi:hypothetical protein